MTVDRKCPADFLTCCRAPLAAAPPALAPRRRFVSFFFYFRKVCYRSPTVFEFFSLAVLILIMSDADGGFRLVFLLEQIKGSMLFCSFFALEGSRSPFLIKTPAARGFVSARGLQGCCCVSGGSVRGYLVAGSGCCSRLLQAFTRSVPGIRQPIIRSVILVDPAADRSVPGFRQLIDLSQGSGGSGSRLSDL